MGVSENYQIRYGILPSDMFKRENDDQQVDLGDFRGTPFSDSQTQTNQIGLS